MFKAFANILFTPDGSIEIHDNAPGCNSQAEIEEPALHQLLKTQLMKKSPFSPTPPPPSSPLI